MDMKFEWRTREEKNEVVRFWWREQKARCHLCREIMEPYSNAAISPWAATIEHLIPRRENGPNTVGNVRLAHRWCNNVLGALWEMNRLRAIRELPPLSANWALTNERGKLHLRKRKPPAEAADEPVAPPPPPRRGNAAKRADAPKLSAQERHDQRKALKAAATALAGTLAGLIANGEVPLPRGATLPAAPAGAKVLVHSRNKSAQLMSAVETARFLRESAERRGKPWPLA